MTRTLAEDQRQLRIAYADAMEMLKEFYQRDRKPKDVKLFVDFERQGRDNVSFGQPVKGEG